jgi:hypothetical protein
MTARQAPDLTENWVADFIVCGKKASLAWLPCWKGIAGLCAHLHRSV